MRHPLSFFTQPREELCLHLRSSSVAEHHFAEALLADDAVEDQQGQRRQGQKHEPRGLGEAPRNQWASMKEFVFSTKTPLEQLLVLAVGHPPKDTQTPINMKSISGSGSKTVQLSSNSVWVL